ncbi:bile acid:sodium symporter family protein [Chitinasiproducens palmae]|uniref:Solute carrier family 10 (Sodium/bile acid cotransporter), member 7 n=1 Tax=Chitinasiproducens palmae TaxID=1770053 RepID=A0A1H2PPZ0_9BURK|nr:bile acid:sodium symporter family protein [Chitinasiproducens palmae]SDV48393.1 solute carrier family 10 (sodium/bile acid cotransporter), member 7 [Chitinasiproducens palmae]
MARPKFLPDNFTLLLVATVVIASFLPCRGEVAVGVQWVTNVAIGLLFFLHGAKLSREALFAAVTHWRLHSLILLSTFVMFPLLGLALRPLLEPVLTPALYAGILFTCTLPSTVQSSIALTSLAKGNVPAAICSASASTMLGIFITPFVAGLILSTGNMMAGSSPLKMLGDIMMQLLLPFVAGQIARRWIGGWVARHRTLLRFVDQGSIILVVYGAFSEAVIEGIWQRVSVTTIILLIVVNLVFLGIALVAVNLVTRKLGFSRADRITAMFCGSKKSLASGVPIARVLFSPQAAGMIVLPLMLFHQVQLMVCSVLAQRWGERDMSQEAGEPSGEPMPHRH